MGPCSVRRRLGGAVELSELGALPPVRGRRLPQAGRVSGRRQRHVVRHARLRLLDARHGPARTDALRRLDPPRTEVGVPLNVTRVQGQF